MSSNADGGNETFRPGCYRGTQQGIQKDFLSYVLTRIKVDTLFQSNLIMSYLAFWKLLCQGKRKEKGKEGGGGWKGKKCSKLPKGKNAKKTPVMLFYGAHMVVISVLCPVGLI